jgi:NADH:ubiquinone oxidoreductase subunit F (NADH-binding)
MTNDILDKIKSANLVGRGGANFPAALKWEAVKNAKGDKKYIVVNCAEGEPGVLKDGYIIANHLDKLMAGIKLAFDFIAPTKVYFYINHIYFNKYGQDILKAAKKIGLGNKLDIFIKKHQHLYIAGEESTILNMIEGKKTEPRLKPPFPTESGLYGCPTLINNVETFYNVALVDKNEFYDFRFYSVTGAVKNKGVYSYPAKWTIKMVLEESKNYQAFPFFVQIGGDMSGEVLNSEQLDKVVSGAGSIKVYDLKKHDSEKGIKDWLSFFRKSSCGQCVPCREGTYRLLEMANAGIPSRAKFNQILDDLESSSFCALGASVPVPIKTYFKNILNNKLIK